MSPPPAQPKLPVQQLAILAVARFAEPLAMTSVFPYLPEMIASFGVEKEAVARWAGITSAVFSLAQSVTAVFWGRASDYFGRKPIIMLGLFLTMTCFVIWGFSTSLSMAITVRAIQGASNGNVGIIRTMVAEMVPERVLQPRAFAVMPLVWSIGSIFGPAFGGVFAKPAQQFPGVFGDSVLFNKFPFLLPNLMGAVVFLISLTTAFLFLRETLASKRYDRDWGISFGVKITEAWQDHRDRDTRQPRPGLPQPSARRYSFQDDEATAPLLRSDSNAQRTYSTISSTSSSAARKRKDRIKSAVPKPPPISAVFTRQSTINLISYTFLALHSVAYDQVLPVFLNYPEELQRDPSNTRLPFVFSGGFGLESGRIGSIFTGYGIVCGLIQFLAFPPLCSRFGALACFRACTTVAFPLVYLLTPYVVLISDPTLRYAALVAVMTVKAGAVIIGFPCTTILLTNSAASLSVLGTLNGFATTFSALGRAAGPAVAGAAFSWGVRRGVIAVPWWILAAVAVVGAVPGWFIVDGDGPSGPATPDEAEAEEEEDADGGDDSGSEEESGEEDRCNGQSDQGGKARRGSASRPLLQ